MAPPAALRASPQGAALAAWQSQFRGALDRLPLRRDVSASRMRWNRLCRATRIAPWGVTPQAARGGQ